VYLAPGSRLRGDERRAPHSHERLPKNHEGNSLLAPVLGRARGVARIPFSLRPPDEGDGAPKRRMPWITPGRPDLCSGEPGSPGPGALARSARASWRTTAAFSAICVLRRPDLAGPVVPRRGYPAAARVRGCELRTQVPRPAPLRTTPRPKRPSVDGTTITNS